MIEHIDDDGGFLDAGDPPPDPCRRWWWSGSRSPAAVHVARRGPRPPPALLAGAVGRLPDPRLEIVSRGGLFASLLPVRAAAACASVAGPPDDHGVGDWSARPGLHLRRAALAADARAGGWLADHGRPTPACRRGRCAVSAGRVTLVVSVFLPCTVVVPCFNEARRLDLSQVEALADVSGSRVLAVDDGSTDATPSCSASSPTPTHRFQVLTLPANAAKGEAVRPGLLAAIDGGAVVVAYCDADFATPPAEVARLVAAVRRPDGRRGHRQPRRCSAPTSAGRRPGTTGVGCSPRPEAWSSAWRCTTPSAGQGVPGHRRAARWCSPGGSSAAGRSTSSPRAVAAIARVRGPLRRAAAAVWCAARWLEDDAVGRARRRRRPGAHPSCPSVCGATAMTLSGPRWARPGSRSVRRATRPGRCAQPLRERFRAASPGPARCAGWPCRRRPAFAEVPDPHLVGEHGNGMPRSCSSANVIPLTGSYNRSELVSYSTVPWPSSPSS